jgi:hypothetical protein
VIGHIITANSPEKTGRDARRRVRDGCRMSGFYSIPKDSGRHEAAPVKEAWRTGDGQPADLLTSA